MSKTQYLKFAEANDLPLFLQPWWLEAAMAGDGDWDAVVEGNAALPYCYKKRLGITNIFIPWCTPYLCAYGDERVLPRLIAKLPNAADYRFRLFPRETPASWTKLGFSASPTRTYVIDAAATDPEKLFSSAAQRQIRKAEKVVQAELSDDWATAYGLWENTMNRKRSVHALAPKNIVESIEKALRSHQQREIWVAKDNSGKVHAAIYVAFDKRSSYYLWGGYDLAYSSSGATTLLFFNAIQSALIAGRSFDFEGSMIESVAKFYAGFGAEEQAVLNLHKSNMIGKLWKK